MEKLLRCHLIEVERGLWSEIGRVSGRQRKEIHTAVVISPCESFFPSVLSVIQIKPSVLRVFQLCAGSERAHLHSDELWSNNRQIIPLAGSLRPRESAKGGTVDICPAYMQQKSTHTQYSFFFFCFLVFFLHLLCKCCSGCFMLLPLLRWLTVGRHQRAERLQWRGSGTQVLIEFHRWAPPADKSHYGARREAAAIPCWPCWPPPQRSEWPKSIKRSDRDKRPRPRRRRPF